MVAVRVLNEPSARSSFPTVVRNACFPNSRPARPFGGRDLAVPKRFNAPRHPVRAEQIAGKP
jgi:hypothetical protein